MHLLKVYWSKLLSFLMNLQQMHLLKVYWSKLLSFPRCVVLYAQGGDFWEKNEALIKEALENSGLCTHMCVGGLLQTDPQERAKTSTASSAPDPGVPHGKNQGQATTGRARLTETREHNHAT